KHHDGFALFDTGNTTHRSSVYLGPKRDFVSELFTAAKNEKPHLHRGTYYSLPECSELEPYTGRLPINDYLDDLQLPHMLDLALKYDTDIMWCDIGGPNRTLEFAARYYNDAWSKGRQQLEQDVVQFLILKLLNTLRLDPLRRKAGNRVREWTPLAMAIMQ
ncbi:hypothetical protein H0H93_016356, partial [Arthromyces matolae]